MKHIIFKENNANKYKIAILIKETALDKNNMLTTYINPLLSKGVLLEDIICISLDYDSNNKAPAKLIKEYIVNLYKTLSKLETKYLLIADSDYFKKISGLKKTDPYYGYCQSIEHGLKVIPTINYQALFYNPKLQEKLDLSLSTLLNTLGNQINNTYDIIHTGSYPATFIEIESWLKKLRTYPRLTCDFETFNLKPHICGIGTVAFAWDQHNGISFSVDYKARKKPFKGLYGKEVLNPEVRKLLKQFFIDYQGTLTYHNASFDVSVAIAQLWMMDISDYPGLLEGLKVMTGKGFDCTKTIIYLATNSCAGNTLGLKPNSYEYCGNYAQDDIADIRKIPLDKLLKYNLIDCLATWYVFNKYTPLMIQDQQEEVYQGLFKETLITLIQMQLTGMPICLEEVNKAKQELLSIVATHKANIDRSSLVNDTVTILKEIFLDQDFNNRKSKAKNPDKIKPKLIQDIHIDFNPGSSKQITVLLYKVMSLPIINTTDTKLPATDEKTLKALINHTDNITYKELITDILELGKANKILTTFIPAFEQALLGRDGIYYLYGNYNLGGTISGRLSSSDPNLTNLPSGSKYGKLIKKCFISSREWLFAGADYSSLEDRINTLLTKDPNKLKVYIDGYDGHSLRAYSYFLDQMPDITSSVESINSIGDKYPKLRQESKAPTFALTYGGQYYTLVKNCGFSEDKAKSIEAKYHELYQVSDAWVFEKLKQASIDGYVTLAFGLRLRTPILKQCMWNTPKMPYEASAEGRSAGNAVSGQSHGLLNCRAANELRMRIAASKYKHDIKISAQIHDAIYLIIRNDIDVVHWVNINLIECMQWQDLPEIQHDQVKLGAELDIYPNWSKPITLPNNATKEEIMEICK